ncbi:hypothetical protein KIM372_00020 [Bombiscardovia nodaiensis]|uniref:Uncharacterized protein n=1 Tax=Bombiscardovia nodaiensis TaxID=2932181 RepID=A0ABN6S776_9BIFI|nr:hypothetical protein KIM372_00020 [Bombiscardovia nodaiensis]
MIMRMTKREICKVVVIISTVDSVDKSKERLQRAAESGWGTAKKMWITVDILMSYAQWISKILFVHKKCGFIP